MTDTTSGSGITAKKTMRKTEAEWRELLTPEQFHVMRQKGTERPFTGALVDTHDDGSYHCGACHAPLFASAPSSIRAAAGQLLAAPVARRHRGA